jgi:lycopene beta-cyclase
MKPNQTYDYILVGLGGATINLLLALKKVGLLAEKKVLVLEPESKTKNDRTWCFWTNHTDPAFLLNKEVISHQWPRVLVNGSVNKSLEPYHYAHLSGKDLYAAGKKLIAENATVTWLQEQVKKVEQHGGKTLAHTTRSSYTAQYIFDSRPPVNKIAPSEVLWQSFAGWRIKTAKPAFEPELCTLMDFEVPQMGATQFMYVLPTSPTEALVELTRFGRAVLLEQEARPVWENYLREKGWEDYTILEKEVSKIPMTLGLNPAKAFYPTTQQIIDVGGRGGAIKASTGFAFKKIAHHAWQIANALKQNEAIPTAYHAFQYNLYDEMLLRLLSEKPHLGKPIFKTLFEKSSLKEVFQFLDEDTDFLTDLKIMWRMPWQPFLWSAGYTLRGHRSIQVNPAPKHAY